MMRKTFVLPALATLALALTPLVGPHVSAAPVAHPATSFHAQIAAAMGRANIGPRITCGGVVGGDVCYDNIPFTGTANGGTGGSSSGCTGTIIGVYGSSALKSLIQQAAKDYCTNTTANPSHFDVEYNATGDSCPGDLYASQDSTDPALGVSDVYVGSCAVEGFLGIDSTKVTDFKLNVNLVNMIATCPGATEPNGGALHPAGTTQCSHFSGDPTANNGSTCAPSNISVPAAALLFNQAIGNELSVGGCNHTNAVENRVAGSGTRVTWCFNVYAAGLDSCNNEGSATGPQATTGAMVGAVCATNAPDGNYAQGYVTRSAVVGDPRSTSNPKTALQSCGVVQLNGVSGYNGACDPANASTTGGAPNPVFPSATDCPGDNDVAAGRYTAWGYEHTVLNTANNALAAGFNTFLQSNAEDVALTQKFGFIRQCQMGFSRANDGDVYNAISASC